MAERLESNKQLWNALTGHHVTSEFYDVEGFKAGNKRLHPIELAEMGDVSSRTLLHLQCHFGQDILSWARLGATVTGVDFSEDAVDFARQLAKDTGLDAEFICSDIYALPDNLTGSYDIVFTSYGAITWLPDLLRWGKIIHRFLKPGGFFYIAEIHPIIQAFYNEDNRGDSSGLKIRNTYFSKGTERYDGGGDYASDFIHDFTTYEWQHTIADVLTALADAGLHVDYLHEFPACCFRALPEMTQSADGMWRLEGDPLPLTYSIKATKPVS